MRAWGAWGGALAVVVLLCGSRASETAPEPGRALGRRLREAGRAETRFVRESEDPISGSTTREPGRLALEPPQFTSVVFTRTGERFTLRRDGGEWVSPRLRQLVILERDRLPPMSLWWRLLMEGSAPGIDVTAESPRRLSLRLDLGGGPRTATLELGPDGFPTRLDIVGVEAYRFLGWTFRRARGAAAFSQKAPPGYEVVRMP